MDWQADLEDDSSSSSQHGDNVVDWQADLDSEQQVFEGR